MTKIWLLTIAILALPAMAAAQGSNDYNKWDFYGGFSLGRFESNVRQASFTSAGGTQTFTGLCTTATGEELGPNSQKFFCARRNFNGFDVSITRNFSRYVGITGNITAHSKKQSFVDKFTPPGVTQTLLNDEHLYNFLGGMQFKDNRRSARLKPFGHVLAGFARYTNRQSQTLDLFPQFNFTIEDQLTSFAMKLGGGVDLRVGKHLDIRLIEADYNPIFAGDRNPKSVSGPFTGVNFRGKMMNNMTIGVGIVIH